MKLFKLGNTNHKLLQLGVKMKALAHELFMNSTHGNFWCLLIFSFSVILADLLAMQRSHHKNSVP